MTSFRVIQCIAQTERKEHRADRTQKAEATWYKSPVRAVFVSTRTRSDTQRETRARGRTQRRRRVLAHVPAQTCARALTHSRRSAECEIRRSRHAKMRRGHMSDARARTHARTHACTHACMHGRTCWRSSTSCMNCTVISCDCLSNEIPGLETIIRSACVRACVRVCVRESFHACVQMSMLLLVDI